MSKSKLMRVHINCCYGIAMMSGLTACGGGGKHPDNSSTGRDQGRAGSFKAKQKRKEEAATEQQRRAGGRRWCRDRGDCILGRFPHLIRKHGTSCLQICRRIVLGIEIIPQTYPSSDFRDMLDTRNRW